LLQDFFLASLFLFLTVKKNLVARKNFLRQEKNLAARKKQKNKKKHFHEWAYNGEKLT